LVGAGAGGQAGFVHQGRDGFAEDVGGDVGGTRRW